MTLAASPPRRRGPLSAWRAWRERRRERAKERGPRRLLANYLPPEGVPLNFVVAGLGSRLVAQIIDIMLTLIGTLAFIVLLNLTDAVPQTALSAIAALVFFFARIPYYVMAEILWNGQTLGKRILGIRVISADGRSLSAHAVTVRNLMKELEVFLPIGLATAATRMEALWAVISLLWVAGLIAIPVFHGRRQRLGDMIAGTYVVRTPKAVLLPDLTAEEGGASAAQFAFAPHHLDHYGRFELQTLERLLHQQPGRQRRAALRRRNELMAEVAGTVAKRIGFTEEIGESSAEAFLRDFYRAQRGYLENRKLLGDAREDKFHRDPESADR
ncbi:MAG: RDD family protein [Pseudomonadota bacterium]